MPLQSENWFNPSKGEEVLWYSHPSFIMRLPKFLLGLVVALTGIVLAFYLYFFQDVPVELVYGSLILTPIGLGWTGGHMLIFKNTWYVITNRRVIRKTGVVGRDSSSKPHREIVRVDVKVSTLDAVLSRLTTEDIGDIVVRTADDSGEKFILKSVPEVGLAESYMERLSGTGPDTPAQYDAEEQNRFKHEQYDGEPGSEKQVGTGTPQTSQAPAAGHNSSNPKPDAHDAQDPSQSAREGPYDSESTQPPSENYSEADAEPSRSLEPPEDEPDEFDEFEPSDKA